MNPRNRRSEVSYARVAGPGVMRITEVQKKSLIATVDLWVSHRFFLPRLKNPPKKVSLFDPARLLPILAISLFDPARIAPKSRDITFYTKNPFFVGSISWVKKSNISKSPKVC